jgi:hypothetical protein
MIANEGTAHSFASLMITHMKRNMFLFGTIAGVLVATFMAISMYVSSCSEGSHGSGAMVVGFASMVVAFSFVFVGIKNYRDKQNGGVITFGQGCWLGFMISFIASSIYVATWAVEFHYVLPDFMDKYGASQIKAWRESGISAAELESRTKEMESTMHDYKSNIFVFIGYTYMEILPVGIIITLISSLILKRKKAETT